VVQNLRQWLSAENGIDAKSIAPDAAITLVKATKEQQLIGWEHWFKGC
jgi:hypothetical protein